jgi:hypothetical protein
MTLGAVEGTAELKQLAKTSAPILFGLDIAV